MNFSRMIAIQRCIIMGIHNTHSTGSFVFRPLVCFFSKFAFSLVSDVFLQEFNTNISLFDASNHFSHMTKETQSGRVTTKFFVSRWWRVLELHWIREWYFKNGIPPHRMRGSASKTTSSWKKHKNIEYGPREREWNQFNNKSLIWVCWSTWELG